MPPYAVAPIEGFREDLFKQLRELPIDCAHGMFKMFDHLEFNDPALRDRCGRIADRYELFAIPTPGCPRRCVIVSIDDRDMTFARVIHGSLPANDFTCNNGFQLAARQRELINPSWEPAP